MPAIPTTVIIPTRDHADTLCSALLDQLLHQGEADRILVYDNRDEPGTRHAGVDWISAPGLTVTQLWNRGWRDAVAFAHGPVNVAILNDDLVIPPSFLSTLSAHLRAHDDLWCVCPDYHRELDQPAPTALRHVIGTYRQGGVCGFAFMVRGELLGDPLEPLDESLRYWCGDDDLVRQIALHGGRCAIVEGLPVHHVGGATGVLYPELHGIGWDDLRRFEEKWG